MQTYTASFFICKVNVPKVLDTGLVKSMPEAYAVVAQDWAEAQYRITEEMIPLYPEGVKITDIHPAKFTEFFQSEDSLDDRFFNARVEFEEEQGNGRIKKRKHEMLIQAADLDDANKKVTEALKTSMLYYTKVRVEDAGLNDIFLNKESKKEEE